MAIFIGIHRMDGPVEESKLSNSWSSYKEAAIKRGLKPLKVNYSAEKGVAICETEAETEEEVMAAHQDVNVLPKEIIEVKSSE
jgi:hypothetical protein